MKSNKKKILGVSAITGLMIVSGVGGMTLAYLTDNGTLMKNSFTLALNNNCSATIVEYFPENIKTEKPTDGSEIIIKEKVVQIANDGDTDEYVRVSLDFTDSVSEDNTEFSRDGTNWYKVSEFKDHLADTGWVYNSADGYYYYTKVLKTGDWDAFKTAKLNETPLEDGHYVYSAESKITDNNDIITTPLIKYIRTTYEKAENASSYGIFVYEENIQASKGKTYTEAWATLNK